MILSEAGADIIMAHGSASVFISHLILHPSKAPTFVHPGTALLSTLAYDIRLVLQTRLSMMTQQSAPDKYSHYHYSYNDSIV